MHDHVVVAINISQLLVTHCQHINSFYLQINYDFLSNKHSALLSTNIYLF